MSELQLPRFVSPQKMARQDALLEGLIPISAMKYVEGLLVGKTGEVGISLKFTRDGEHTVITGKLHGAVPMQCQRCLEVVSVDVSADISLACVHADYVSRSLPPQFEPFLMVDEQIDLYELAREELLLNLPIIAYHAPDQCENNLIVPIAKKRNNRQIRNTEGNEKVRPFAVLKQLKSDL